MTSAVKLSPGGNCMSGRLHEYQPLDTSPINVQNVNDCGLNSITKGSDLLPSPSGPPSLDSSDSNSLPGSVDDIKRQSSRHTKTSICSPTMPFSISDNSKQNKDSTDYNSVSSRENNSPVNMDTTKENMLQIGWKRKCMPGQEGFVGSQEELILLSSAVKLLSNGGLSGNGLFSQIAAVQAAHYQANGNTISNNEHQVLQNSNRKRPIDDSFRESDERLERTKRKESKLDRFFWDTELHNKFLEAILCLGVNQERPMELCMLFAQSGASSEPEFSIEDLNTQCTILRERAKIATEVMQQQLKIAYRYAPICTKINEKKGGNPAFHVYPFPYGDFKISENLIGHEDSDYSRRFLAAVFDLGLQYARPKSIFKFMQPTPREMTTGSIKSHLQKYRTNSKATREMFLHQFRRGCNDKEFQSSSFAITATSLMDRFNNFVNQSSQLHQTSKSNTEEIQDENSKFEHH